MKSGNATTFWEVTTVKNDMIWAYMLKLSTHMWDDESTPAPAWYLEPTYTEENKIDLSVWDDTVKFLAERQYNLVLIDVGDGIKYESHPEISAPNAWDKDFLKKKLSEMRALGLEPIPKLNFSACHDTWLKEYRRMLSTPIYYRVCADLIREVCEVFFYPRLFHLGFDEETYDLQKNYECAIIRGAKLWWNDLFYLCAECEKHGARPWVWSDYIWNNQELFLKNMPKSVLQSNWYYGRFRQYPESDSRRVMIDAYELLDKHGYEQIPTGSTWQADPNLYQTVAHGKACLTPSLLKGFLAAPWQYTVKESRFTIMDDAERMFIARQKLYPETLK